MSLEKHQLLMIRKLSFKVFWSLLHQQGISGKEVSLISQVSFRSIKVYLGSNLLQNWLNNVPLSNQEIVLLTFLSQCMQISTRKIFLLSSYLIY